MDKNRTNIKLVSDEKIAETSSKGNQEKWFDVETNQWYKLDQFGYEALSESLISILLEKSNIEKNWDRNNHGSIIIISANATGVCRGRKYALYICAVCTCKSYSA